MPPLGPPVRVPAGVRALALTAGLALLAAVSAWCGWEIASRDLNRLRALPYVLPLVAVLAATLLAWTTTVWKLRCDGRVLDGVGVLGRQGIDLAALTGVAAARSRQNVTLTLRTDAGPLQFDSGALESAGRPVYDAVGRAVWAGQEQGRYQVPALVAGVWGMPVQPGAPDKGRSGAGVPIAVTLGVCLVALVVGLVLGFA